MHSEHWHGAGAAAAGTSVAAYGATVMQRALAGVETPPSSQYKRDEAKSSYGKVPFASAADAQKKLAKAAMDGTAAEAREFHCNCLEHDAKEEVAAAIVCLGANNPANIAALAKAGAGEMLAAIIASVEGRGPAKRAEK